jgi:lipopolysaccharide export system protein LptA
MTVFLALLTACGASSAPRAISSSEPGVVLEDVQARLPAAAPAPSLHVTAQRAAWDLAGRTVRFEGEVHGTRGDVTLTCATLEVWFTDPDALDRARASGGVQVHQGVREARADTALLDIPAGRIELAGSPWMREGGRRMAGERIVLLLDDERVECEACTLDLVETLPEAGP